VAKIGRNAACPCGSGKKYKKCCEAEPVREARFAVVSGGGPEATTDLLIETEDGVAVRRIPPAMPLLTGGNQGKEAEDATHGAASTWGLADFVFPPSVRRRASGVRELGDGLIVVGDLGIVLQVKSRECAGGDPERERRWINKQVRRAQAQGMGTIRELHRGVSRLTNLRGRSLELDASSREWLVAVVIDHPDPPIDVTPEVSARSIVLLRRDWDFLFDQLKSTQGVARYMRRVAGESLALGDEPVRYYDLALADESAEPSPLSAAHFFPGMKRHSEPSLPMAPVASEDETEHHLYRTILEDIAKIQLEESEEELRLLALADLDRLFPEQRALVAAFLLEKFDEVAKTDPSEVEWHQRRIALDDSTQIALGVCSRFD
jgi:hypothetical protein